MRRVLRLSIPALLIGLLLSLGVAAAACGDDDEDSSGEPTAIENGDTEPTAEDGEPTEASEPSSGLEDYFAELDALEDELRSNQAASEAAFAALDETATVEDVVALLEEVQDFIDAFVEGLEDIEPPEEAAAAHEETIAGFQTVSATAGEAIDASDTFATVDELFAVFDTPEAVEAEEALDATCRALQTIADGNGIAVDLGCNE
jgi:hypothetical protein